jgi:hypothetical protein
MPLYTRRINSCLPPGADIPTEAVSWSTSKLSRRDLNRTPAMKTVLVIFILTIQSSYSNNVEMPGSSRSFDTVQFFAARDSAWRVKTYARDEDVHIWNIKSHADEILSVAKKNTLKNYGDVIRETYVIETNDGIEGLHKELSRRGLDDHLEVSPSGAVFWTPAGTKYRTQSRPQSN